MKTIKGTGGWVDDGFAYLVLIVLIMCEESRSLEAERIPD